MQVIDLVQKIADWRASLGGGSDLGISIPAFEGGIWIPEVSTPAVSCLTQLHTNACKCTVPDDLGECLMILQTSGRLACTDSASVR